MSADQVQALWDEHVAWSVTADRLKNTRELFRKIVLFLTFLGATLATLAARVGPSRTSTGIAIAGTVALAIAPFLTRFFLTAENTRSWLRARSISEGIKSEIYRYVAAAKPYGDADSLSTLTAKVREIREWGASLQLERAKTVAKQQPAPRPMGAPQYLQERVRQQIEQYYRPKARTFAVLSGRFRMTEIALAGAAAILSAAATVLGDAGVGTLAPWVAVLTTLGATLAAHAAAGRFDFQSTTFFATARQLEDLTQDWQQSGNTAPGKEWSEFVRLCEEAISAENRGWMAKLDEHK